MKIGVFFDRLSRIFFFLFWSLVILFLQNTTTTCFGATQWSGELGAEYWHFPEEGLHDEQEKSNSSVFAKIKYSLEWNQSSQSIIAELFARYDSVDEKRSYIDFQDLYFVSIYDQWELYAGVRKVFWGVTEFIHLVDTINQSNLAENSSGEEKLGQPMINLVLIKDWGSVDFFILPGFRERVFPGERGRFRFELDVDTENPVYKHSQESSKVDFALRSFHTIGYVDLGFSIFSGTERMPLLVPEFNSSELVLVPYYNVVDQIGLEFQWNWQSWIVKIEGIAQKKESAVKNISGDYSAIVGGVEYTFVNLNNRGTDITLVAEYIYDDREDIQQTPFHHNLFSGIRFALNDEQDSSLLLSVTYDMDSSSKIWSISASRRIGQSITFHVEGADYSAIKQEEILYAFRKDSYLQAKLIYHF